MQQQDLYCPTWKSRNAPLSKACTGVGVGGFSACPSRTFSAPTRFGVVPTTRETTCNPTITIGISLVWETIKCSASRSTSTDASAEKWSFGSNSSPKPVNRRGGCITKSAGKPTLAGFGNLMEIQGEIDAVAKTSTTDAVVEKKS